jgi:hypothetical protein
MQHLRIGHALAKSPVTFREMRRSSTETDIFLFFNHSAAGRPPGASQKPVKSRFAIEWDMDIAPYFPIIIAIIGFLTVFAGIYVDHRLAKKREAKAKAQESLRKAA